MIVIAKSNRNVDYSLTIGTYELTVIPRSLFTADDSFLPCIDKSKLINLLNALPGDNELFITDLKISGHKVAIVVGMVVLQKLKKTSAMHAINDLTTTYCTNLQTLTCEFDEIH